MPIRKFHSIEEMDKAKSDLWGEPGPELYRRIDQLWKQSSRLNPRALPKGVFKFRNIEELQAHHESLLTEHVRRLQKERQEGGRLRVVQKGIFDPEKQSEPR